MDGVNLGFDVCLQRFQESTLEYGARSLHLSAINKASRHERCATSRTKGRKLMRFAAEICTKLVGLVLHLCAVNTQVCRQNYNRIPIVNSVVQVRVSNFTTQRKLCWCKDPRHVMLHPQFQT